MAHKNVQRLQERQRIAVRIDSPAFHHGFHEGMTEEHLRHDCGVIAGWLLRQEV